MSAVGVEIPEVSWSDFRRNLRWKQGEHVTLIGPTGAGKTTLALELLPLRDYVITFGTKRRDPVLRELRKDGYVQVPDWTISDPEVLPKVILSPPLKRGVASLNDQRKIFKEALVTVFRQGGWCMYLDEARYVTEYLKLKEDVELLWQQGRSLGVSVLAGAQRPRHIPLLAYDQATHLFFWQDNDESNLRRIGEIGGKVNPRVVQRQVSMLHSHQVLYVNARTGEAARTRVS